MIDTPLRTPGGAEDTSSLTGARDSARVDAHMTQHKIDPYSLALWRMGYFGAPVISLILIGPAFRLAGSTGSAADALESLSLIARALNGGALGCPCNPGTRWLPTGV